MRYIVVSYRKSEHEIHDRCKDDYSGQHVDGGVSVGAATLDIDPKVS